MHPSVNKATMRIRSLLRLSFLLISFLLLGGTGFSFYALYSVQRDVQNIYEIRLRSTGFLLEADRDAYQSNLAGLHSIYATRKIKDIEENRDQVLQRFEKFETFDGSMVTSATIGLLDEQRAVLYYTNAEHPWTVLYRDGQARFLEQETRLRRIGFPWIEDLFYLHVTRLESGDTVIFGSDGRDDLILGTDKNNDYIINTDENLFLQSVEQAHGKLEPLSTILSGIGDFVDDVSLLRIAIPDGHGPETFQKTRNPDVRFIPPDQLSVEAKRLEDAGGIQSGDPAHVRSLFTIYQRMGDPRAADAILRYSDLRPESNSVLLGAVRILENHGRFAEAVDASERLRLRDRRLVRNLEILARLHRTLGNTDRERTILLEVDGLRRSLRGQT